jgi:hypothetical protein
MASGIHKHHKLSLILLLNALDINRRHTRREFLIYVKSRNRVSTLLLYYLHKPTNCHSGDSDGFSLELSTVFYGMGIYGRVLRACFEKVINLPNLHKPSNIP